MTQGPNRVLDEFAKLMTDAAGVADGFRREAETAIKFQAERIMAEMDVVKRDDFEAIKEMAANARAENDALKSRIEALETRVKKLEAGAKTPKPKPAAKK
ncbi:MAG: accessory factor UbiK family protein [Rhizobiaceae bacterium]